MNTVPSGLGLSGNNRNFGPDQSIGQCGLTHIWAPHNGHETTFKCCISHDEPFCCFCSLIALIANAAAACSAARRLRPWAWVLMASLLIAQLTVNVWLCAAPSVAITVYTGKSMRKPWTISCNKVLASLPRVLGSKFRIKGAYIR